MKWKRRPERVFLAVDDLGRLIQIAIDDLTSKRGAARVSRRVRDFDPDRHPAYEGFCARSCEAYVFLVRDPRTGHLGDPNLEARYVKLSSARGDSHYWLENEKGILDLNFGPHDECDARYCDYDDGKPPTRVDGFRPWKDDPRYPRNADARKIMDAVWRRLGADELGTDEV